MSGELWAGDIQTGHSERLLPDFVMEHYDISGDGKRIAFAGIDEAGHSGASHAGGDDRHLGYAKHDQAGNNSGNSRNGKTTKALKGDFGELPLETPRDRNGTFEPKIVAKDRPGSRASTTRSCRCTRGE